MLAMCPNKGEGLLILYGHMLILFFSNKVANLVMLNL